MKHRIRRPLVFIGLGLVAFVLLLVGAVASAFIGQAPIQDGREVGSFVRLVKDGFVTIGVIDVGGGQAALIDAGLDSEGHALLAELRRRGVGPDAITAVMLTHGHGDHTAACHLFPKAQILALGAEIPIVEGREAGRSPVARLRGAKLTGIRVTRALHDGERFALGDRSIQVFAVPGHTIGSAAYLVDGVLFLGDSAGSTSGGKITGAPYIFSDDTEQNHASLRALAERLRPVAGDVRALVPAHSGALPGLGPLLAFRD